ncbi:MAG: hypothetical protein AAF458_06305 [Pseudomonadota bacterium]
MLSMRFALPSNTLTPLLLLLTLCFASQRVAAISLGPGEVLTFDYDFSAYDVSSLPPSSNPHTFELEIFESPASIGDSSNSYDLAVGVLANSGTLVAPFPLTITGSDPPAAINPGVLTFTADITSALDLIGTVSIAITAGNFTLANIVSADFRLLDGQNVLQASMSADESAMTVVQASAPAAMWLVLGGLGLVAGGRPRARGRRVHPSSA